MERVMDIGEVRRCRGSRKLGLRARRGEVGLPTRASNFGREHQLVFRTLGSKIQMVMLQCLVVFE